MTLEAAVPASKSKNDGIFNALLPHIHKAASRVCFRLIGPVVSHQITLGEYEGIRDMGAELACIQAFTDNIRSLDVVLTNTGFGVVSTQDTAPASIARVDALADQLEKQALLLQDALLDQLVAIDGWDGDPQDYIPTVFYKFHHLRLYAAKRNPTADDWWAALPLINDAHDLLTLTIGDAQMGTLLEHIGTDKVTQEEQVVITTMRRLIGLYILGKGKGHIQMHRLLSYMDDHIEAFPCYQESETYKARHMESYENTKDSSLYVFQG